MYCLLANRKPPPKQRYIFVFFKVFDVTLAFKSDEYLTNNDHGGHNERISESPQHALPQTQSQPSVIDSQGKRLNQEVAKRKPKTKTSTVCNDIYEVNERNFTRLLLANIRLRDGSKTQLSCDICDYRTPRRDRMLVHMNRLHRPSIGEDHLKPHRCDICGIRMAELYNLNQHMKIHSGIKAFACSYKSCNSRFLTAAQCRLHMRRHLDEKPFKCDQCPAAFIGQSQLNWHTSYRHSDRRPYDCETCGQSFKLRDTWKQHQLTHTNIKQFHCPLCERTFRKRYALNVHMNVHTDNRPYNCNVCERTFHSPAARCSHMKVFHKIV